MKDKDFKIDKKLLGHLEEAYYKAREEALKAIDLAHKKPTYKNRDAASEACDKKRKTFKAWNRAHGNNY